MDLSKLIPADKRDKVLLAASIKTVIASGRTVYVYDKSGVRVGLDPESAAKLLEMLDAPAAEAPAAKAETENKVEAEAPKTVRKTTKRSAPKKKAE